MCVHSVAPEDGKDVSCIVSDTICLFNMQRSIATHNWLQVCVSVCVCVCVCVCMCMHVYTTSSSLSTSLPPPLPSSFCREGTGVDMWLERQADSICYLQQHNATFAKKTLLLQQDRLTTDSGDSREGLSGQDCMGPSGIIPPVTATVHIATH